MSGIAAVGYVLSWNRVASILLIVQSLWMTVAFVPNLQFEVRLVVTAVFLFLIAILFGMKKTTHCYLPGGKFIIQFATFCAAFLGLSHLMRFAISSNPVASFVYISLGYDNAVHVGNYQGFLSSNGHTSFTGLPDGLHLMWVLLTKLLFFPINSYVDVLANVGTMFALSWGYLFLTASTIIFQAHKRLGRSFLITAIFAGVLTFGNYGFMLTSGFWPYTWAIATIFLVAIATHKESNPKVIFVNLILGAFVTFIVCPPVSLVIFVIAGKHFLQEASHLISRQKTWFKPLVISAVTLTIFATGYAAYNQLVRFGLRQIFELGGIEPLSTIWLGVLAICVATYLFVVLRHQGEEYHPISQILISSLLVSLAFVMTTYAVNGSITYYAIKQVHVTGVILLLAVLTIQLKKPLGSLSFLTVVTGIFLTCSLIVGLYPRVFTSAFMGSSVSAAKLMFNDEQWAIQVINGPRVIKALKSTTLNPGECGVFWTQSSDPTLASRWFTTLQPKPNGTDCFDIYYDSQNQGDDQVLSEIANPDLDVLLIVDDRPLTSNQEKQVAITGDRVVRLGE